MTDIERLQQQIDILQDTVTKLTGGTVEVVKPISPIQKYRNLRSDIFYKYYPKMFDQKLHTSALGSLTNQLFFMLIQNEASYPCIQSILFGNTPDDENIEYVQLYSKIYDVLCKTTAEILKPLIEDWERKDVK